jgi:hypothetical protein
VVATSAVATFLNVPQEQVITVQYIKRTLLHLYIPQKFAKHFTVLSTHPDLGFLMQLGGQQLSKSQWRFLSIIYISMVYISTVSIFQRQLISTAAYFNVHIFQFLMRGGSSLCDTMLFECQARSIASLTLMKGRSSLRDTRLIKCLVRAIAPLFLCDSAFPIVSLEYIIKQPKKLDLPCTHSHSNNCTLSGLSICKILQYSLPFNRTVQLNFSAPFFVKHFLRESCKPSQM